MMIYAKKGQLYTYTEQETIRIIQNVAQIYFLNKKNAYIKVACPSSIKNWNKCAFVITGECPPHLT